MGVHEHTKKKKRVGSGEEKYAQKEWEIKRSEDEQAIKWAVT